MALFGTVFQLLRNRRFLTVICYQLHKYHANNLVIFLAQLLAARWSSYRAGNARDFPPGRMPIFQTPSHSGGLTTWVSGHFWACVASSCLARSTRLVSQHQKASNFAPTVYLVADISMTVACLGRKAQRRRAGVLRQMRLRCG